MEIGGIGKNYPASLPGKDLASAEGTVLQDQQTNPAYEKYDRLVHGLTKFTEATEKADEEAKARAKQKLKDAQEQLKFMQRWGMNPEVIARQAAQLGAVVAAAAREFADALAGGGVAIGATSSLPAADDSAKVAEMPQSDATGEAVEEQAASPAEQAYRDVMDDGEPTGTSGLSADDIRTAMEFSTIARQIKALLEEAARNLREQRNAAVSTGTQNLDAAVAAISNVVATAPSPTITI